MIYRILWSFASTVEECDAMCHSYSGCEVFGIGLATGCCPGRCDLFRPCPSYQVISNWYFDLYYTSTHVFKKYVL